jgi:ABC-2 type transport system ATP-binding protein
MAVILLEHVAKQYGRDIGKKKTWALRDLSFAVKRGEVFGIIGPNGAGKSTTLKILMGFIRPDRGSVRLDDQGPSLPAAHRQIGYLPENPCLYENLTLGDHLSFAGRVFGMKAKEIRARMKEILALVDLEQAGSTPIRRFSKGMTQRAALAYALFHRPKILVLDEPMSGLDPLGRQLVVEIIRDYNTQGNTILFCSHILTDVERICDQIAIMNQGRLAATIRPEELKNTPPSEANGTSPLESIFLKTVAPEKISPLN